MNRYLTLLLFCFPFCVDAQTLLHYWNFNNSTSESALLSPDFTIGNASITPSLGVSGAIMTTGNSAEGFDLNNLNARNSDVSGSHLMINNPIGTTLDFTISSAGYKDIIIKYATRRSNTGAGVQLIYVSSDGTNFSFWDSIFPSDINPQLETIDLSASTSVNDKSTLIIRVAFAQYLGGTSGDNRIDNFTVEGTSLGSDQTAPSVTFFPANTQPFIQLNAQPSITFNEAVRMVNDVAIDNTNVDAVVELREGSASGTAVPFDASFAGTTITISPSSALKYSTTYYVALKANSIEDLADNAISTTQSITFNTMVPQTIFQNADIMFVAYRMDAASTTDEFAFVSWVDIIEGTRIMFSNANYTDNTPAQCAGSLTWTAPAGGISAGTVVTIQPQLLTANLGAVAGVSFDLANNGEQIFAFTGTESSPEYITAISSNNWVGAQTNCTAPTSKRPLSLSDVTSIQLSTANGNVSGNTANAFYNGIQSGATTFLKANIVNPLNWNGSAAGSTVQTWPTWNFESPTFGIDEINGNFFSFYPNPAKNMIYFSENSSIEIIDSKGQIVLNASEIRELNIQDLRNGIYIIRSEKAEYNKLVILR